MLCLDDAIRDTSSSTGTTAFTLDGLPPNSHRAFSTIRRPDGTAIQAADTFPYTIRHRTLTEWEDGLATVTATSPFSFTREPIASSNAHALVSFSAGIKDVVLAMNSAQFLTIDGDTF